MSEAALKWAAEQCAPDPLSKFLLFRLAAYADAQGFVWVFVRLLAAEMGVSERTVQNRLRTLFGAALLEETGRTWRTRTNRLVPVRRLPMEKAAAVVLDAYDDRPAMGEPSCTPQDSATGEAAFTGEAPPCTPTGEAMFTRIRTEVEPKESSDELSPRNRDVTDAFSRFWAIYPRKVEQSAAFRIFERIVRKRLATADELISGAQRYVIAVRDRSTDMVKHPTTWLQRECWRESVSPSKTQQADEQQGFSRTEFAGPAELRAAIVAERGEAWARSWLDPCGWDPDAAQLLPLTAFAGDRLQKEFRPLLRARGMSVAEPQRKIG